MSTMSYLFEERLCRICGGYDVEYRDGHYVLFQVSIRRYEHAQCMVEKFGPAGALGRLRHDWHKPLFREALKHKIQKGKGHPLGKAVKS